MLMTQIHCVNLVLKFILKNISSVNLLFMIFQPIPLVLILHSPLFIFQLKPAKSEARIFLPPCRWDVASGFCGQGPGATSPVSLHLYVLEYIMCGVADWRTGGVHRLNQQLKCVVWQQGFNAPPFPRSPRFSQLDFPAIFPCAGNFCCPAICTLQKLIRFAARRSF